MNRTRNYAVGEEQCLGTLFVKRNAEYYSATIDCGYFQVVGFGQTSESAVADALVAYDERMLGLDEEMV